MEKRFDINNYVANLGRELVFEFTQAKLSTQAVAIGSNKESSVINKLSNILPSGVGIGSGFVYDSFGNVSNQSDIILYEKDFCIKATINNDEKNSFYNCESVIAVGEIKSTLGTNELTDIVNKFVNLNKLKRFKTQAENGTNRQYLSKMGLDHNFDNTPLERTEYDRIYKFVLCEKLNVSMDSIIKCLKDLTSEKDEIFNTMLDLQGKHIMFSNRGKITLSPFFSTDMFMAKDEDASITFNRFIYHLCHFIREGTTVPLNYSRYFNTGHEFNIVEMKPLI